MKKKGFTLIELLVVIAIIAMLLAILMPALNKVKKIAQRVVCGTNLKGLGTAQTVYANDYEDQYTLQGGGGAHTWSANATHGWNSPGRDWRGDPGSITVGASLYLLVREADVSPKSFVCPSSTQTAYDGKNPQNLDLVELWDFGPPPPHSPHGPANAVSYAYQQPYAAGQPNSQSTGSPGRYAASATKNASFAVMADRNPFMDPKIILGGADQNNWQDRVRLIFCDWDGTSLQDWQIEVGNAYAHDRDGQNVTFGDGHSSYEKRADVGEKHDNIYTPQNLSDTANNGANGIRIGMWVAQDASFGQPAYPRSSSDSYLVNDSVAQQP